MRRLFIPALCLFTSAVLPLAGCDSQQAESDLIGLWTLEDVTSASGQDVPGPLGSTLTLDSRGTLALNSGNDCSGSYTSEYVSGAQILTLRYDACTERATTPETDLSLVVGGYTAGGVRYSLSHGDTASELVLTGFFGGGATRLRFVAHSR